MPFTLRALAADLGGGARRFHLHREIRRSKRTEAADENRHVEAERCTLLVFSAEGTASEFSRSEDSGAIGAFPPSDLLIS
jgi:hypothetical protein